MRTIIEALPLNPFGGRRAFKAGERNNNGGNTHACFSSCPGGCCPFVLHDVGTRNRYRAQSHPQALRQRSRAESAAPELGRPVSGEARRANDGRAPVSASR